MKPLTWTLFFLFAGLSASLGFAQGRTIICLGDSLTAGYGLREEMAYPHLVERELREQGLEITFINAGISGSTTASGKARLQWLLKAHGNPEVLLLALGANDGLRGQDLQKAKDHLESIIVLAKSKGIKVLLAGMRIPSNYGVAYSRQFELMYGELAKLHQLPLIPFLLENVALQPEMNLPDGLHPNAKGHEEMAKTVLTHLRPLLKDPT